MNGPPLVVYGSLRRWSPAGFRATLQGYFLPASAAVMGGYRLAGLWTATVTRVYLVSLLVVAVVILIGQALNRRMQSGFLILVHIGLVLIGIALLVQAVPPRVV